MNEWLVEQLINGNVECPDPVRLTPGRPADEDGGIEGWVYLKTSAFGVPWGMVLIDFMRIC